MKLWINIVKSQQLQFKGLALVPAQVSHAGWVEILDHFHLLIAIFPDAREYSRKKKSIVTGKSHSQVQQAVRPKPRYTSSTFFSSQVLWTLTARYWSNSIVHSWHTVWYLFISSCLVHPGHRLLYKHSITIFLKWLYVLSQGTTREYKNSIYSWTRSRNK